ncbi:hypothetical protein AERO8C_70209 [Aeromonas veronii]|uniref:Uncharacterized protein n=1 Tax=Aeromonas veronii TaxID=654 RepID=A0A653LB49_AERVE|nr:hypothetical protein AERO8C_70209 [Aeromonas veronii]
MQHEIRQLQQWIKLWVTLGMKSDPKALDP